MKKILLLVALLVATSAHAQSTRDQATANLMGLGMPGQLAAEVAGLSTGLGVVPNNTYIKARNAANSANINLVGTNASNQVSIAPDSTLMINANNGATYYGSGLYASGAVPLLGVDTVDGTDNKSISLTAGTAASSARSGFVTASGNEVASIGGTVNIVGGNAASGNVRLAISNAAAQVRVVNASDSTAWYFDNAGTLTADGTNGGNIVMTKAKTGVVFPSGTVAATGSTQADAAALPTTVQRVTAADATKGVKLGALSTYTTGQVILIANAAAAVLKLYSDAAGETINGTAGTTAFSIAANAVVQCYKYDTTNWYCG